MEKLELRSAPRTSLALLHAAQNPRWGKHKYKPYSNTHTHALKSSWLWAWCGIYFVAVFLMQTNILCFFLIKCVNTVIKQHSGLMFLYNCYWANADAKMNNGAEHMQHSHLKFLLMIIGRATDDTREQKGSNRRGETACQNCEASSDLPLVPDHSTRSRDGF